VPHEFIMRIASSPFGSRLIPPPHITAWLPGPRPTGGQPLASRLPLHPLVARTLRLTPPRLAMKLTISSQVSSVPPISALNRAASSSTAVEPVGDVRSGVAAVDQLAVDVPGRERHVRHARHRPAEFDVGRRGVAVARPASVLVLVQDLGRPSVERFDIREGDDRGRRGRAVQTLLERVGFPQVQDPLDAVGGPYGLVGRGRRGRAHLHASSNGRPASAMRRSAVAK
jgi:hypothetical protein